VWIIPIVLNPDARYKVGAVVPQHPLERLCRLNAEGPQLTFAQRALWLMPQRSDCGFEASCEGLLMRGETELSLERPIALLQEVYGEQLAIGPLTIRYHRGALVEEPHMGVRVLCAARDFQAVRNDLVERGAKILDEEVTQIVGVVRATAPLAKLLGFPRRLLTLTAGGARELMWLSHYQPCDPQPLEAEAR
jgi:elongation factor G-like protein